MIAKSVRNLGKVFTPEKTAEFMVRKGGFLKDKVIIEPCAGKGVFVRKLLENGASPKNIFAFDIDPQFSRIYSELNINFHICDFLLSDVSNRIPGGVVDFVIGNPPYLSRHSLYMRTHGNELRKGYEHIGVSDTYTLFIYRAFSLLRNGGVLCFITSDTFLTLKYHEKLRLFLLNNAKIKEIVLAPKNVFSGQGVSVFPCIIVLEKCSNSNDALDNSVTYVGRLRSQDEYLSPRRIERIPQRYFLKVTGFPLSININHYTVKLLNSLEKISKVMDGHIGMHTHNNKKYIAIVAETSLAKGFRGNARKIIPRHELGRAKWRPYLKSGGDRKYWYEIEKAVDWTKKARKEYDMPRKNRFGKEGVAISGISKTLSARYMPAGCLWDTNKVMGFIPKDRRVTINYLLGVLNSKFFNFLAKGILNTTNSIQIENIRSLPFIYPEVGTLNKIGYLVEKIVKKLKENPKSHFYKEQEQIDELVFNLYKTPKSLRIYIKKHF